MRTDAPACPLATLALDASAGGPAPPLTGFIRAYREMHEEWIAHVREMARLAGEARGATYEWAADELAEGEHPAMLRSKALDWLDRAREAAPALGTAEADEQFEHEADGHLDALEDAIAGRDLDASRPVFAPLAGMALRFAFTRDRTMRSWPTPPDVAEILDAGLPPDPDPPLLPGDPPGPEAPP